MDHNLMRNALRQVSLVGSRSIRSPSIRWGFLLALTVAAAAGCGGGSDGSSGPAESGSAAPGASAPPGGSVAPGGSGTPPPAAPPLTFPVSFAVTGTGTGTVTVNSTPPVSCSVGTTCAGSVPAGNYTLTANLVGANIVEAWTGACAASVAPATVCNVTVTGPGTLTGGVKISPSFLLTVTMASAASAADKVTSNIGGIDCRGSNTGTCSATFAAGAVVTLTASPDLLSEQFSPGWSGSGCAGIGTCVVTMNANSGATATFSPATNSGLVVSVAGGGTVTSSGGASDVNCTKTGSGAILGQCLGTYAPGPSMSMSAAADPGYTFAGWFSNSASGGANAIAAGCTGTTSPCTFTKTSAAQYLTAVFTPSAAGPSPLLLYTDIASGPTTGGEGDNGIYLSIFGKNFGGTGLGTGTVKVYLDNIEVANYRATAATALPAIGPSRGRPDIQQISTQVGAVGNAGNGSALPVKVVADGRVSVDPSSLTFTVNPGTIYFASLSGSDANPGTFASPFRTVQAPGTNTGGGGGCPIGSAIQPVATAGAWGQARPGDFIVMRGGTWSDIGRDNFFLRALNKSGTAPTGATGSGPIAIMGYPGETARIERLGTGTNQPGAAFSSADSVRQGDGCGSWITIANLQMESGKNDGVINTQEAAFNPNGSNWRVVNNELTAVSCASNQTCKGAAIAGSGLGNYWVGNHAHDIDDMPGGGTDLENHGIYLQEDGSFEIAYNLFEDIIGGNGLQINASATLVGNINFHHNIIRRVGKHGFNLAAGSGDNIRIWNNLITDTQFAGLRMGNGDSITNLKLYNNVFYNTGLAGNAATGALQNQMAATAANQVDIRNNIFWPVVSGYTSSGGDPNEDFTSNVGPITNNLWFGGAGTNPATTFSSASLSTNPLLVTPGTDFHLQSGSPARNAGSAAVAAVVVDDHDTATATQSRTLRPAEGVFDIGAYEFFP